MSQKNKIRKRETFELRLSKLELIHLRDLFGILLSTEASQTVSQALARAEDRPVIETRLWQRIVAACRQAGLPLNEDAPDFICAVSAMEPPPVGVFRIAQEPEDVAPEKAATKNPFPNDEEE